MANGSQTSPVLSRVREQRRRRLLDSALTTFLREGYQGTTVEQVAEEAGVSRQTLYNYFADKEELFIALVEERKLGEQMPRLQAALELVASTDTETGLAAAVRVLLDHCLQPDTTGLWRLMLEVAEELPDVAAQLRERIFAQGHAAVREALQRGMAAGRLRPVDPDVAAAVIFGTTTAYGLLGPVVLGDRLLGVERMAAGFADLLAHGLAAVPAAE
jgi:AcrR family transcriptional regulator